jgi:hypothetical protein
MVGAGRFERPTTCAQRCRSYFAEIGYFRRIYCSEMQSAYGTLLSFVEVPAFRILIFIYTGSNSELVGIRELDQSRAGRIHTARAGRKLHLKFAPEPILTCCERKTSSIPIPRRSWRSGLGFSSSARATNERTESHEIGVVQIGHVNSFQGLLSRKPVVSKFGPSA